MKEVNLLKGSISRSLTLLAFPIMATYLIQMAYNLIDMLWIGSLGSGVVAAVGVAGQFMYLANGLVNMPKAGSQALVGQKIGAGNRNQAREYVRAAFQITLCFAVLYGVFVILFQDMLVHFFKLSSPQVVMDAKRYLSITCGLVLFSFCNQTFTGILTAAGHTKVAFQASVSGLIINIFLDPVLIFGWFFFPEMGCTGAAIATVFSQICVTVFFLFAVRKMDLFQELHIFKEINGKYICNILRIGFPYSLQSILVSMIAMVVARFVSYYGDVSIAVQKIGAQIESVSWLISDGFSASLNAFTAQNYGAGNKERIRKGYLVGILIVTSWGLFTTALLTIFPVPIFKCFIREEAIIPAGISYLRILGTSQLFICLEGATQGAFIGLGHTIPPSIVCVVFNGIRIPLAWILSRYMGVDGIWWALSISSYLKGTIMVGWYMLSSRKILPGPAAHGI